MGETPDLTVAILREIRDEIRATNARLDVTNARLDETNTRLDRMFQEQIRHATAIVALEAGQRDLIGGQRELVAAVGRVVDAVVAVDRRVSALEQGQGRIVDELRAINGRLDRVLTGPMGTAVREHDARLDAVEARVDVLERRTG